MNLHTQYNAIKIVIEIIIWCDWSMLWSNFHGIGDYCDQHWVGSVNIVISLTLGLIGWNCDSIEFDWPALCSTFWSDWSNMSIYVWFNWSFLFCKTSSLSVEPRISMFAISRYLGHSYSKVYVRQTICMLSSSVP